MNILRHRQLTKAEEKRMNELIDQAVREEVLRVDAEFRVDVDSMILYVLHVHYGFGKKRLREFWDMFIDEHKALRNYYQMHSPGDGGYLARYKLKQIGVDVEAWEAEDELPSNPPGTP